MVHSLEVKWFRYWATVHVKEGHKKLLDEDPCRTQEKWESFLSIRSYATAISRRLHTLGLIQKQGPCPIYDFKTTNIERHFFAYEQMLQWRTAWELPRHGSTSLPRPSIHTATVTPHIWTKPSLRTSIDFSWCDWAEHCEKNCYNTQCSALRCQTLKNIPWKTQIGSSISPVVFPRYSPSDYYLFHSIAHRVDVHQFGSYENIKKMAWFMHTRKRWTLSLTILELCQKQGKNLYPVVGNILNYRSIYNHFPIAKFRVHRQSEVICNFK